VNVPPTADQPVETHCHTLQQTVFPNRLGRVLRTARIHLAASAVNWGHVILVNPNKKRIMAGIWSGLRAPLKLGGTASRKQQNQKECQAERYG